MFDTSNIETKTKRLKKYYDLCYKLWYEKYSQSDEFKFKDPDIKVFCDYQIKYETDNYNKAKDIYKEYFKTEFSDYKNVYLEFIKLLEENKKDNVCNFKEIKEQHINDFVHIILKFIDELLNDGKINRLTRKFDEEVKNEDEWRDYFRGLFNDYKERNFEAIPEAKIRDGRIDLNVKDKNDNNREYKFEFKLWYNDDKRQIVEQICSYLTDFNKYGFIIMINTCKQKKIEEKYENIVKQPEMKYQEETWMPIKYNDYYFYRSIHEFNAIKEIYHFIINPNRIIKKKRKII